MAAIRERGFFWWFDEPNLPAHSISSSVPGLLTVTSEGQIELEVDGSLCNSEGNEDWTQRRILPASRRIVGQLASPRDYVLLEGLEHTDISLSDDFPQQQTFTAELCTKRNSPFPGGFTGNTSSELRVEMTGFEDWLELDSVLVDNEYTLGEVNRVQVSYKDQKMNYSTSGGSLGIESVTTGAHPLFFSPTHPRREAHFKQHYYLMFRPDAQSTVENLRYVYSKLEELLALFLGSYYRLNWPIVISKEEPNDSSNTLYFYRGTETKEINRYRVWVSFPRIQGDLGNLFRNWLLGSEIFGAGYYLYVASIRNPHTYTEDRFVNLVSGIEALHRERLAEPDTSERVLREKERVEKILRLVPEESEGRKWLKRQLKYAHEPSLQTRILQSLRELPFSFGNGQLERFAVTCADRRNDIAHEGGPRGNIDYASFHTETSRLAEALDHLFHALLLHHIGISPSALLEVMTNSLVSSHIERALKEVGLEIKPLAQSQSPSEVRQPSPK